MKDYKKKEQEPHSVLIMLASLCHQIQITSAAPDAYS